MSTTYTQHFNFGKQENYSDLFSMGIITANWDSLDSILYEFDTGKQDKLSAAQLAAVNSGITSEDVEQISANTAALAELVDGGAKNHLTESDFSATAQVEIPIKIPAGTYVIYRSNLTSSDTDYTSCLCRFYDNSGGTNVQRASVGLARGEAKSTVITVTGDTTFMRIYASDTAAHSTGDTVTGTDFMVCTKAAWDISHAFQPYRPTYQELYDMVLALQQS